MNGISYGEITHFSKSKHGLSVSDSLNGAGPVALVVVQHETTWGSHSPTGFLDGGHHFGHASCLSHPVRWTLGFRLATTEQMLA